MGLESQVSEERTGDLLFMSNKDDRVQPEIEARTADGARWDPKAAWRRIGGTGANPIFQHAGAQESPHGQWTTVDLYAAGDEGVSVVNGHVVMAWARGCVWRTARSVLGVSRPHLASSRQPVARRRGRPPAPDAELLAAIQALIADLPTYGYRRVHALLRQAQRDGQTAPNVKRVYRVMRVHGLLLQRHAGGAEARRHEGKVAVATRNTRWCSDGLEIASENGDRVRVAFALDWCDREAMSYVATTAGLTGEDERDRMVIAVEHRIGRVNQLPTLIEWLTDNGSCYLARDTRRFARDIGLVPKTTPLESPQSNGMAEAFVRTLKRDYVRVSILPDAESVLRQLPLWLAHYNDLHPHRALGYRSPREFIARSTQETLSGL